MSLSPLATFRALGLSCSGLEISAAETGLRGLYSTRQRAPGSSILSVPFRSIVTPEHFAPSAAVGNQKLAWDAAIRAGSRLFTEQPKKSMVALSPHEQVATVVLAVAQIEISAKEELLARGRLTRSQFLQGLTPLQRWITWLPHDREPQPLGRRVTRIPGQSQEAQASRLALARKQEATSAAKAHQETKSYFNEDEDDYFFCYHSGMDALCSNLVDAMGQGNLSSVVTAIYEEGGGDELLHPVTKWALHQARARTLWVPAPVASAKEVVKQSKTMPKCCERRKLIPILAPGLDFVNHYQGLASGPNARVRMDPISRTAVLEVLPSLGRELRAGEEIVLRYLPPQWNQTLQSYETDAREVEISPNVQEGALGSATVNHNLPLKPKWQWQLTYGFVPRGIKA